MDRNTRIKKRILDIDEVLDIWYEKLASFEKEVAIAGSAAERFSLRKAITDEIHPKIEQYESEYTSLIDKVDIFSSLSSAQIDEFVSDFASAVISLKDSSHKRGSTHDMPSELKQADSVLSSNLPADGKIKAIIPLIPGLLRYEFTIDAHRFLRSIWERFRGRTKASIVD